MSQTGKTAAKSALAILVTVLVVAGLGRLLLADVPLVPSNTWSATGDMDQARAGAASSLLFDGHVLITGGMNDGGVAKSAERYSAEAQGFIAAADMGDARANHSST